MFLARYRWPKIRKDQTVRSGTMEEVLMIFVKRVYDTAQKSDGPRFLVDHLWPRGMKKAAANVGALMALKLRERKSLKS